MQINSQTLPMLPQSTFKGSVDKAVIQKIKLMEKDTITKQIQMANRKGVSINPKLIESIKARYSRAIEILQIKAKLLFNDSTLVAEKNGHICVTNKKVSDGYYMMEPKHSGFMYRASNEFKDMINKKELSKDPVVIGDRDYYRWGTSYKYGHDLLTSNPKTLDELEFVIEQFEPNRTNKSMLEARKGELLDYIKHNNIKSVNTRIKKQVKKVYDVEKELAPKDRKTGFWFAAKEQIAKNVEQARLEKENSKYL